MKVSLAGAGKQALKIPHLVFADCTHTVFAIKVPLASID